MLDRFGPWVIGVSLAIAAICGFSVPVLVARITAGVPITAAILAVGALVVVILGALGVAVLTIRMGRKRP